MSPLAGFINRITLLITFLLTALIPVYAEAGEKSGGLLADVDSLKRSFFFLLVILFILLMWELAASKGTKTLIADKAHYNDRRKHKSKNKKASRAVVAEDEEDALENLLKSAKDAVSLGEEARHAVKVDVKTEEEADEAGINKNKPLPGLGEHPLLRDGPLLRPVSDGHHSWEVPSRSLEEEKAMNSVNSVVLAEEKESRFGREPLPESISGKAVERRASEIGERPASQGVAQKERVREEKAGQQIPAWAKDEAPAAAQGILFKAADTRIESRGKAEEDMEAPVRRPRVVSEEKIKEVEKEEKEKEDGRRRKEQEKVKKIQEEVSFKRVSPLKKGEEEIKPSLPKKTPEKMSPAASSPVAESAAVVKGEDAALEEKTSGKTLEDVVKSDRRAQDLSSTLKDIMRKKK
ncbi:MAG: hypothetical protein M1269_01625 [Chloroflexi bacterium]|nr:hypothetical protein [Chloroflexota bacterium]